MWNNYRQTFPTRYITSGYFDEQVSKLVKELKPQSILDLGGGVSGTEVLRDIGTSVYLLDPYVDKVPTWMNGRVEWDTEKKFELIVARGSINYLNDEELTRVKTFLSDDGVLVANTFLVPPSEEWVEREYTNLLGDVGIERFRFNSDKGYVEHELVPKDDQVIRHNFFYRSEKEWEKYFPNIEIIKHKSNSAVILYKKKSRE